MSFAGDRREPRSGGKPDHGGDTDYGCRCGIPVFRPVIGMDKEEIIRIARKIDTFETSILPYEDCCTVMTPRHPRTRPKLFEVEKAEIGMDVDSLVETAFQATEVIRVYPKRG